MTDLERELAATLAHVVDQNFDTEDEELFWTGFLTVHKHALMLLVRLGIMEEMFPEKKWGERWERLYYAKFKKDWEQNL